LTPNGDGDATVEALDDLAGALRLFTTRTEGVLEAVERARRMRVAGATQQAVVATEPVLLGFWSGPVQELLEALREYRLRHAHALHDSGMSMAELGRLLGVSRQRVAVILDGHSDSSDG
jgi:hypothetical protein